MCIRDSPWSLIFLRLRFFFVVSQTWLVAGCSPNMKTLWCFCHAFLYLLSFFIWCMNRTGGVYIMILTLVCFLTVEGKAGGAWSPGSITNVTILFWCYTLLGRVLEDELGGLGCVFWTKKQRMFMHVSGEGWLVHLPLQPSSRRVFFCVPLFCVLWCSFVVCFTCVSYLCSLPTAWRGQGLWRLMCKLSIFGNMECIELIVELVFSRIYKMSRLLASFSLGIDRNRIWLLLKSTRIPQYVKSIDQIFYQGSVVIGSLFFFSGSTRIPVCQ